MKFFRLSVTVVEVTYKMNIPVIVLFSLIQESIDKLEKDRDKKKDIIQDKTVSLLVYVCVHFCNVYKARITHLEKLQFSMASLIIFFNLPGLYRSLFFL